MATDFIFAYGSNMNRSELRSWIEASGYDSSLIVEATPATLQGYDFVWNYYSHGKAGGTVNLEHKVVRLLIQEVYQSDIYIHHLYGLPGGGAQDILQLQGLRDGVADGV